MIDRICFPRPCELPPIKAKHRGCVIFCPWCESLYHQRVIQGDWKWQMISADEARLHIKVNNGHL